MLILLISIYVLVSASLTAFIAGQRGYRFSTWYFIGLLGGPLSLVVLLLPRHRHEPEALFE